MAAPDGAEPALRRGYLDWLRGLAVLVMIEAHVLDSWTQPADRHTLVYSWSMILGGFGAPLFLFLAGVSVSLSAGSRTRRTGDATAASRAVARRGLQIFALAFLFRVQAMVVSWGTWRSLLKVDILNIMGPAIVAAAWLWGVARTPRGRAVVMLAATITVALLTPPIRLTPILAFLPDPIEGYLRPRPGYSSFVVFPWAAFVFAGAFVGVLLDGTRVKPAETRLNLQLALAGIALAIGGYAASFLPTLYARSDFWTSSPAFFFLRTGLLIASVGVAYGWQQAMGMGWSPLRQMGRTSLFIYWIHVELIYGLIVRPLHKSLSLPQAWLGVLVFAAVMLIASIVKERVAEIWRARRERAAPERVSL